MRFMRILQGLFQHGVIRSPSHARFILECFSVKVLEDSKGGECSLHIDEEHQLDLCYIGNVQSEPV